MTDVSVRAVEALMVCVTAAAGLVVLLVSRPHQTG